MNESIEMYLETILLLSKNKDKVRSIDIARELKYSKPSISRAISLLKDKGFIDVCNNSIILTKEGLDFANDVYLKHTIITKFLIRTLKISFEEASINACKIEHVITDECFLKMREFVGE